MSVAASSGSRDGVATADGALACAPRAPHIRSLPDQPSLAAAPDPDLAVADLDLEVLAGERVDRLVRQPRATVGAERLHRPALDEELSVAQAQLPARLLRREQVVGHH